MVLDDESSGWALISNLALLRFLGGEKPYLRQFHTSPGVCVLLVGDGWTGTISSSISRQTYIQITAESDELAQTISKQIAVKVPEPPPTPEQVPMVFWHHNGAAVRQTPRRIETPATPAKHEIG